MPIKSDIENPPEWYKVKAGTHPAFTAEVSNEELQAAMKMRQYLTPKSLWLEDCKEAARANHILLQAAIESKLNARIVNQYRLALVVALINLDEFEEAQRFIRNGKGKLISTFKDFPKRIKRLKEAIERGDSEECDCKRPQAVIPHHETATEHLIELPRRERIGWQYSKKHKKVLEVYECRLCGDLNAMPDVPESQSAFRTAKANAQSQMLALQRKGVKVNVHNFDMSAAIPDTELFKPSK